MSYQTAKPSYPLSLFIRQYWAIEDCLPDEKIHIQRIIPSGMMELMFYASSKPRSIDGKTIYPENSVLSGHQKGFYDLAVTGRLSMFSVSFLPHGAMLFFNIPCYEFVNQHVPLKYIAAERCDALENKLFEARSFPEKVQIVESFLKQRLFVKKDYGLSRMVRCIDLIRSSKGNVSIEFLSKETCLSRKQFERSFLDYVGISPKHFLRTIRFQNSLHEKRLCKDLSLTQLAYKCGYFDQSHMINDYKTFSGKTPGQYFSECEPYSDFF